MKEAIETELKRGGQVFFVHNRVRSIGSMEKFLDELVPRPRCRRGPRADGRGAAREGDEPLRGARARRAARHHHHRERPRHPERQHHHRQPGRPLRAVAALPDPRPGRPQPRARLRLPARAGAAPGHQGRPASGSRCCSASASWGPASRSPRTTSRSAAPATCSARTSPGQIEAVGFELYTQLLDEAVRELKGEAPREEIDPDVQLPVPAFIPDPYMPDVHQRLYFYKRFAQASTDEELEELRAEIVDRCGDPPDEVDALFEVMKVKVRLRALRIRALETRARADRAHAGREGGARSVPAREARAGLERRAPAHPGHEAGGPARAPRRRRAGARRPRRDPRRGPGRAGRRRGPRRCRW